MSLGDKTFLTDNDSSKQWMGFYTSLQEKVSQRINEVPTRNRAETPIRRA
jgi:hypothetical protein